MATLSNDQGSSFSYITTFDGRLVQRVPEGTEGAQSRELQKGDNAGKLVWEKTYSSVEGMITGGGVEVKDFGAKKVKEIQVMLDDDIMLQLPMNMLARFAKPLPNLDATKPVKISVFKNKAGRSGLTISQESDDGSFEKLDWAYTKEEPNGLPQPVKDEDDGTWDFRDHDKFLIKKVKAFFASLDASEQPPVVKEAKKLLDEDGMDIPF